MCKLGSRNYTTSTSDTIHGLGCLVVMAVVGTRIIHVPHLAGAHKFVIKSSLEICKIMQEFSSLEISLVWKYASLEMRNYQV